MCTLEVDLTTDKLQPKHNRTSSQNGWFPSIQNYAVFYKIQWDIEIFFVLNSDIVDTEESIVHSYTKSFNALAAKLSEDEAQKIAGTN